MTAPATKEFNVEHAGTLYRAVAKTYEAEFGVAVKITLFGNREITGQFKLLNSPEFRGYEEIQKMSMNELLELGISKFQEAVSTETLRFTEQWKTTVYLRLN